MPDVCADGGCEFYSTAQYVKDLEMRAQSAALWTGVSRAALVVVIGMNALVW